MSVEYISDTMSHQNFTMKILCQADHKSICKHMQMRIDLSNQVMDTVPYTRGIASAEQEC